MKKRVLFPFFSFQGLPFHIINQSRCLYAAALILCKANPFPHIGLKKRAEPAFTSAEVRRASKFCSRGRFYAISYTLKKRAEPAFTSAEVRRASKFCSCGRFYAISYTLKKRAEPAFTSAEVHHASKFCSRGRFYAISYTLKRTCGIFIPHVQKIIQTNRRRHRRSERPDR